MCPGLCKLPLGDMLKKNTFLQLKILKDSLGFPGGDNSSLLLILQET